MVLNYEYPPPALSRRGLGLGDFSGGVSFVVSCTSAWCSVLFAVVNRPLSFARVPVRFMLLLNLSRSLIPCCLPPKPFYDRGPKKVCCDRGTE